MRLSDHLQFRGCSGIEAPVITVLTLGFFVTLPHIFRSELRKRGGSRWYSRCRFSEVDAFLCSDYTGLMTDTKQKVYDTLDEMGIGYRSYDHPPVFTVEEAEEYWADIEGVHVKNLFLRDKKGKRHILVVLRHEKGLDIKELEKKIGADRLSFASESRLETYLGLSKGSVSAFGLINDTERAVEVVIDSDILREERIGFHPNINTATLTISVEDFQKFLKAQGNKVEYVDL